MLTCNICSRKFRNQQALSRHLANPGNSHGGQRRRSDQRSAQPAQPTPGGRPPQPPRVLAPPVQTTRVSHETSLSAVTAAGLALCTRRLSGNTGTAFPGLPTGVKIVKITVEFKGTLAAAGKIAWAAVVAGAEPNTAPTRAAVLDAGGVGSHDGGAAALVERLSGPPITTDAITERHLVITLDRIASARADDYSAVIIMHVDYASTNTASAFPTF